MAGLWRAMEHRPDFAVVAESDDYIVVDKPAPLQVHPAKPNSPPTLLDGVRDLLAYELTNGATLSIINRLDRETSGLVLIAKHRGAARVFGKAMMRRLVEKRYLAVVYGWPDEDEFTVDAPLRRQGEFAESAVRLLQAVHSEGAASRTTCRVMRRGVWEAGAAEPLRMALVEARPLTGRMHQIRVHLSHAGHPIVGDKLYGPDGPSSYLEFIQTGWTASLQKRLLVPRHSLHSSHLAMEIESSGPLSWSSALPPDLAAIVCAETTGTAPCA